jgi:uncharacterized protein (DUF488 family)
MIRVRTQTSGPALNTDDFLTYCSVLHSNLPSLAQISRQLLLTTPATSHHQEQQENTGERNHQRAGHEVVFDWVI